MAITNHERMGKALDLLKAGLGPFVQREVQGAIESGKLDAHKLHRLAGMAGDPVVQLQTNFGGGKTHSMLALYHLFSGTAPENTAAPAPTPRTASANCSGGDCSIVEFDDYNPTLMYVTNACRTCYVRDSDMPVGLMNIGSSR